jgi:hypothetical protein
MGGQRLRDGKDQQTAIATRELVSLLLTKYLDKKVLEKEAGSATRTDKESG